MTTIISHCELGEQSPHMPVRRLHNYVYCPRLFYLQWVENVFVDNEDTVEGRALHRRVDEPVRTKESCLLEEGGSLKSLYLSSDVLGLTGIVDIIEQTVDGQRCLLDYKKGSPARGEDGNWKVKDNDAVQLAAYSLLLEESGINIDKAAIYYAEIRKRVYVELTESLRTRVIKYLGEARRIAESQVCPPPLCDSRCLYCSAYSVCLPFETRAWGMAKKSENPPPRPPMPPCDGGELLFVQNREAQVGIHGGEIVVRLKGELISKHPIHQLEALCLYGAIQVSAQAQQALMEQGIPISWFSPAGRFIGTAQGLPCSGVDARMGQYRVWSSPELRLAIASQIIRAKIHNQRVMLMRNAKCENDVLKQMAVLRDSCAEQVSLQALRGIEGRAAALYFANFSGMLKTEQGFDFEGRNRRPPKDPVNALLSMGYSMLVKELTGIAFMVGLDPFLGFLHSPRYGRPALALDMMEEFRPLIADSTVITLINRGEITADDFENTSRGVLLKDSARRQFWRAWTRRLDTEITHPEFGYKMTYRRMLVVQMRQLWRLYKNEISTYHPFVTR